MKPIDRSDWQTMKGYEDIADLSVVRGDDGALYSLWRPSIKERVRIAFGVPVAVGVLSQCQPPITVVVGENNVPASGGSRG